MLTKVKTALLITEVPSFKVSYSVIAREIGVELMAEERWSSAYKVNTDVVILGSKHLEELNPAYYNLAVVILRKDENPFPYIAMGITRFIYDYKNQYELMFALYRQEKVYVHASSSSLQDLLKHSNGGLYKFGEYEFNFYGNRFLYFGKPLYITESEQKYLIEWLINGHKDNDKRMMLCNMRKKFGKEFLKDVDRHGQYKGGYYEG